MTIKDIKSVLDAIIVAKVRRDNAIKEAYANYNAAIAAAAVTNSAEIDFILPPNDTYGKTIKIGYTLYDRIKNDLHRLSKTNKLDGTVKANPDDFAIEYNGYIFSAVNRI